MKVQQYTLSIQEIRQETDSSITVCFKKPALRKIKYKPGQFITLILNINGRKYYRPYSFSSAPSVDTFLEITVKTIPGGIVSNFIYNELKVGDAVEVLEPMGDFTCESINLTDNVYLWGVGSGITPLFSILKEILHTKPGTNVHLIYGNKNQESTIFRNQLGILKQKYHSCFSITNFYSQAEGTEHDEGSFLKGRISSSFITHLLAENENIRESIHYICGPSDLKDTIKKALLNISTPVSSILIEDFQLVIDSKDLADVKNSKVAIQFQGLSKEIFVPKGQNILDAALNQNMNLPYSCQTGNCNTCKAKLIDGKLKMIGMTNKRSDLAQDEFLLCCSYPLDEQTTIEII